MPTPDCTMTHTYSDTPNGVVAMLSANFEGDFDDCTFQSDPYVAGVWMLTNANGGQCIAFLAGYPDPFGHVRERSDAEFSDDGWNF